MNMLNALMQWLQDHPTYQIIFDYDGVYVQTEDDQFNLVIVAEFETIEGIMDWVRDVNF